MKRFRKGDMIILILISAVTVLWFAGSFLDSLHTGGLTAVITQSGEQIRQIRPSDVAEPCLLTVGGCEILVESDGVSFLKADCPDGLCTAYGKLTRAGETMACVPNGVAVSLSGASSAADAVAY